MCLPGSGVRDVKLAELRPRGPAAGHEELLVILDEPPIEPLDQGALTHRPPRVLTHISSDTVESSPYSPICRFFIAPYPSVIASGCKK